MWFKKKSVLLAEGNYNTEKSVDGTDWRINNNGNSWPASNTLPSTANANNYFYLPALGNYYTGLPSYVGNYGYYWSSSVYPWSSDGAYFLGFTSSNVAVGNANRGGGYRVVEFE